MKSLRDTTAPIRVRAVAICLSIAVGFAGVACSTPRPAEDQNVPGTAHSARRMPDGKQWMTENLDVIPGSYCYDDTEANCHRYGRLYTWESAQRGCRSLGDGWRLPTDAQWRQLAKHYGGVHDGSDGSGKAAFTALLSGGSSGFNALLGAVAFPMVASTHGWKPHGFYWTASESGPATAWFHNFAKGRLTLFPQSEGEKERAFSVRCVRE